VPVANLFLHIPAIKVGGKKKGGGEGRKERKEKKRVRNLKRKKQAGRGFPILRRLKKGKKKGKRGVE